MSVNQTNINNDLNSIGLMGKFLSKISPNELKAHKSFHEVIQKKEEKLNKYVISNPHFSELNQSPLHYKKLIHSKLNPKKILLKKMTIIRQKNPSPLEKSQNKQASSMSVVLPKIQKVNNKNTSLIIKNAFAKEEDIDRELQEELLKEQDILFATNKKQKRYKEISERKMPWFMKISKDDPLHPLYDDDINSIKRSAKCLNEPEEKNEFLEIMKDAFQYQEPYISRSSDNDFNIKRYGEINKLFYLYQKCKNNINRGMSINQYIGKYCEQFNEVCNEIQQKKKKMTQNKDRPLIEEKKKEETKYERMKEKIIAQRKKKINQLISENFAHNNRAEFEKKLKEHEREDPYELFLIDLNNEAPAKKKRIDRENSQLDLIVNILDNTIKDKEYLKGKIEEQSEKYRVLSIYNSAKVSYPASSEYFKKSFSQSDIKAKKTMFRHKSFDAISREVYEQLRAEMKKKNLRGNRETIFN